MVNNFDGQTENEVRDILLVEGGKVTNVIKATPEFILTHFSSLEAAFIRDVLPAPIPGIGWAWSEEGSFSPPVSSVG